jgi:hypothetical protein
MIRRTFVAPVLLVVGAALLTAACQSGETAPRMAPLSVHLTDAPFPVSEVQSADMYVVRVDAKLAEATDAEAAEGVAGDESNRDPDRGWVTIARPERRIDLLALRGGSTTNLGQMTLPTGRYLGFRLVLDTDRSSITLKDGTLLAGNRTPGIHWPSAGRTGVKVNLSQPIQLVEDGTAMVIDFDLAQSFVLRGSTIGEQGLNFKPVIRATARDLTGAVSGTVRAGSASGPAIPGAMVEVLRAGTALDDTVSANVVTTTSADAQGAFTAAFLLPASYTLRITPPAAQQVAYASALVPAITVTASGDGTPVQVVLPVK